MDISAVDSGSRVTRSLRKRLTSIDNDNSSRPGTPLSTKLTSITEISASPSKSTRSTRHNSVSSVSTPVKTPAKRGASSSVISENSETPLAVRKSRRRSVFTNDNDEIRQACIQISTDVVLAEEQSDGKQTITTRSKSRSPQQDNSSTESSSPKKTNIPTDDKPKEIELNTKTLFAKKRKPGPKSKTFENSEFHDMSDVEVSVLEDEIADIKNKSSNVTILLLTDDDSTQTSNIKEKDFQEDKKGLKPYSQLTNANANPINIDALSVKKENQVIERNNDKLIDESTLGSYENVVEEIIPESINDCQSEKVDNDEQKLHDHYKNKDEQLISKQDISQTKPNLGGDNSGETMVFLKLDALDVSKGSNANSNESKTSDEKKCELSKEKNCEKEEFVCNEIANNSLTPDIKSTPEKFEIVSASTTTPNNCNDVLKKVDFTPSQSNDTSIKTVYPKTPASTKAAISGKKLLSCSETDPCVFDSCLENLDLEITEDNKIAERDKDAGLQIIQAKSPKSEQMEIPNTSEINQSSNRTSYGQNLKMVDGDKNEVTAEKTPIGLEGCAHKEVDLPTKVVAENYSDPTHNEDEKDLKWIYPSTKRNTVEGSKLDELSALNNASVNNIENEIAQNQTDKQKLAFSSDDEVEVEEDDNDDCDDEYGRKNDFIDDEAMEVENYESGDSMDSEERAEIEMNQIPDDAESIGSQNTDDDECEYVEEKDSLNSFIVSDDGNFENCENDISEGEDIYESKVKANKKLYRRIQCQIASSSSSDESEEKEPDACRKVGDDGIDSPTLNTQNEQKEISSSIVEEEADFEKKSINLKCKKGESESFSEQNSSNKSSNTINLDASKLSDSALRLHYASYSKSEEEDNEEGTNISRKEILSNYKHELRLNKSFRDLNSEVDEPPSENHDTCKVTLAENSDNEENKNSLLSEEVYIQTESQLGEVSATSESDVDKENKSNKSLIISNGSFDNCKNTKGKVECQRSFTIDVTVKNGELKTKLADDKSREKKLDDLSPSCIQENYVFENKGIECLDNMKGHMSLPLGNPLIRTRRQSLALPTNPDMEICSTSYVKRDRKSVGMLSNIDLKPSQSFIEDLELLKNDQNKLSAKRKRYSKSFGGSTEAHDYSIADINACHPRKRSKLMDESSIEESDQESEEQIGFRKLFTQVSSTPHERINTNDSFNRRILTRCDEILETANRAKLEAKIRNKKNKPKTIKKSKKKSAVNLSEDTSCVKKVITSVPMEIKPKDKTTTAISRAFKAADAILNKPTLNKVRKVFENSLAPDVTEAIRKTAAIKKKCVKEINQQMETIENVCATSAGNFIEFSQEPEKKKKVKYIQLPSGKVSVEPATPKKNFARTFRGKPFRESPLTPCAVGGRVKKIDSPQYNKSVSTIVSSGKRKRYNDELLKNITGPKAQWTQSGLFREEVIFNRNTASKKTKTRHIQRQEGNQCSVHNFKENALSRSGINRGTKRELIMIKERKRACGTINNNI